MDAQWAAVIPGGFPWRVTRKTTPPFFSTFRLALYRSRLAWVWASSWAVGSVGSDFLRPVGFSFAFLGNRNALANFFRFSGSVIAMVRFIGPCSSGE